VLVATVAALGVRAVRERDRRIPVALLAVALAVIVGNLWATTLTVNDMAIGDAVTGQVNPSFNDQVRGSVPDSLKESDSAFYYAVYVALRDGADYYSEAHRLFKEQKGGRSPNSVVNYRFPLVFFAWAALPGPEWIVPSYLVLASIATLSVVPLASGIVRLPIVIPAAGALAGYFLYFPTQLGLFSQEHWAATFALVALAATAVSLRNERWRTWTVVGVAAALVAVLVRDAMVFVLVGGIVSAAFATASQRRWRLVAWLVGTGVVAAAYAAHFARARAFTDPASAAGTFDRGSVAFLLQALTFATTRLGEAGWLPWVLALAGLSGALLVTRVELRAFALTSSLGPLAAFLVIGNDARHAQTGLPMNYWGAIVVPILYACIPFLFLWLPTAAARGLEGARAS